ncbi:hypothetical protein [Cohnella fermenti]|uniref:Uncharacterized protein n=1 Tax=Cohnella fermenti TaxID=2565925 RepID=A0A4S4BWN5_9BACL|nr:hypothetical protein [Cohnella fermenti]THF79586.1 hypothetical protein E6C55_12500 [Cohnella fermenti]
MIEFKFKTSSKVREYCEAIIQEMMSQFNITFEEGVDRINQKWGHFKVKTDEDDMIFHMLPVEWAKIIYYGADARWWDKNEKLTPAPYTPSRE